MLAAGVRSSCIRGVGGRARGRRRTRFVASPPERSAESPCRATLQSVNRSLIAELAALLAEPPGTAEAALEHAPPLAELLELAARAHRLEASAEELALALGALVAVHAPRSGAFEH